MDADPTTPDVLEVTDETRIRREAHRQVTDREALHAILDEALVAHLAVVRDGLPVVLPFACARDGDTLLLHGSTGAGGMRLAAGMPISVAVTHVDGLVFARTTFESSMRYRSAVVHGEPEVLAGEDRARAMQVLSEHLFPGRTAEVREPSLKELAATLVLRLPLDRVGVKIAAGPPEVLPDDVEPREVWAGIVPLALAAGEPVAAPDVPDGVAVPASVRRSLARHRLPD